MTKMTQYASEDFGLRRSRVFSIEYIHEKDLNICEYSIFANATPEWSEFTNQIDLKPLILANRFGSQTDQSQMLPFGNAVIRE